eukprot:4565183-Pyramimonas_sp.AAC.1
MFQSSYLQSKVEVESWMLEAGSQGAPLVESGGPWVEVEVKSPMLDVSLWAEVDSWRWMMVGAGIRSLVVEGGLVEVVRRWVEVEGWERAGVDVGSRNLVAGGQLVEFVGGRRATSACDPHI